MLRIAIVTPMLPVPYDRTRGHYIHETVRALGKLATVRTYFQTLKYPNIPGLRSSSFIYGKTDSNYQLDGCDVEAYSYRALPVLTRSINGHLASRELLPRARRFKPDIIIGYWVYPDGFSALRVAHALGVPCVIGALGSDIHVRSGLNVYMTRKTIKAADAVITVSKAMRQHAIHQFDASSDRVHTVINGFNTAIFWPRSRQECRSSLGIGEEEKLIIYVGRFVEAKGMRELIEAFQELARRDPLVTLALVGDGTMREELTRLVEQSGLRGRVHMPGGQPPEKVAEWIGASNALTLPSWSEGYPNVLVEAIACGRPVVATYVGGIREIVNDKNGLLVPPKDPQALTAALQAVLHLSWNAKEISSHIHRTWDEVAQDTLAVCKRVLEKKYHKN